MFKIPFNRPSLAGREWEYMADAIHRRQISGDGYFSKACEKFLQAKLDAESVLMTSSCTHALEMCALLLDLSSEDEVIIPSYTFVSTACAFALRGAKPVFCDVREDTLNIDEKKLSDCISPRTRAIVVVHYSGVACAMESILDIAARNKLLVIEDNAHGLLGSYRGRLLGSWGSLATQSFHETKNISCGEGGALIINDAVLVERAEIIRDKGTNRKRFFRGQVDKYSWMSLGSSYVMSDLLAAYLLAQLEQYDVIHQKRARLWTRYATSLQEWAEANRVRLPSIPEDCQHTYHSYYLICPDLHFRSELIRHLGSRGILAVFHYQALNASPMGRKLGGVPGTCPVAERLSDTLVRLPLFNSMTDDEQSEVIEAVETFAKSYQS